MFVGIRNTIPDVPAAIHRETQRSSSSAVVVEQETLSPEEPSRVVVTRAQEAPRQSGSKVLPPPIPPRVVKSDEVIEIKADDRDKLNPIEPNRVDKDDTVIVPSVPEEIVKKAEATWATYVPKDANILKIVIAFAIVSGTVYLGRKIIRGS